MKIRPFPMTVGTQFLALITWIGSFPQLGAAELSQVDVQCGVVYSLITSSTPYNPRNMSGQMGSADWSYVLYLTYAPFVTVKNNTGWPLTLDGGDSGQNPNVTFAQPELGLRFKRVGDSHAGFLTNQSVPLDQMYVSESGGSNKVFSMKLVGSGSPQPGFATVQSGETKVFTPVIPFSAVFDDVFDWRSNMTSAIQASPGWKGAGNGYIVDYLTGAATLVPAVNADFRVVPNRLQDSWEVEIQPTAALNGCRVFRAPSNPSLAWPMNPEPELQVTQFPLTCTTPPSTFIRVAATDPVRHWVVHPIFSVLLPPTVQTRFITDRTKNGMNDEWEKHFFNGGTASATADEDGDGFSNLFEFLAGTSPVDASDFIRQSLVGQPDGGLRYEWSSLANRSYIVETSTDLSTWISSEMITAAGATTSYPVVRPESGQLFVRARIIPPQQTGL